MAKQKGVLKLEGTLDGINFYMLNGVAVARKAGGGFSSKAIKHAPNMERVRQNSSEFGRCSQMKRLIKESLYVLLKDTKDTTLHGRMMRMMQQIKVLDSVSERGQRKVVNGLATSLGKQLFYDFSFTENFHITTFKKVSVVVNTSDFSCVMTGFDLENVLFPKEATHLKLTYLVCSYDFEALTFINYEVSLFLEPADLAVTPLTFTPHLPLQDVKQVLCFFGLSFYQQVGGEKYVLKNKNAIGVSCVHISL